MEKETVNKIRLGLLVTIGTIIFVLAMYFIGDKQHLFGSNIRIYAVFNNVSGLQRGNNVRFAGIDVGTVRGIDILSDTAVKVEMVIDRKVQEFIKTDAVAIIGTDGLMGNKIINIGLGSAGAKSVEEGAVLSTFEVFNTDAVLRTLAKTNVNVAIVADNLAEAIQKMNTGKGTIGKLMNDTTLAYNLSEILENVRALSEHAREISGSVNRTLAKMDLENRIEGSVLTDTALAGELRQTVHDLREAGANAEAITEDLREIVDQVNRGEGTAGRLLTDTAVSAALERSLLEIEEGARGFNENMEALKHNILLRGYFKKQEKAREKEQGTTN